MHKRWRGQELPDWRQRPPPSSPRAVTVSRGQRGSIVSEEGSSQCHRRRGPVPISAPQPPRRNRGTGPRPELLGKGLRALTLRAPPAVHVRSWDNSRRGLGAPPPPAAARALRPPPSRVLVPAAAAARLFSRCGRRGAGGGAEEAEAGRAGGGRARRAERGGGAAGRLWGGG